MAEREEPAAEWMQRMRQAFMNAITEDDMRELAKGLMERAKRGDREALRLVLTYTMPQPVPTTRHERVTADVRRREPRVIEGRRANGELGHQQ